MGAKEAVDKDFDQLYLSNDKRRVNEKMENGGQPIFEHFLLAECDQEYTFPSQLFISGNLLRLAKKDVSAQSRKLLKCPIKCNESNKCENDLLDHEARIDDEVNLIQFDQLNEKDNFEYKAHFMDDKQIKILNKSQIQQKIKRLSYQILERHFGESELILAGINNNGFGFAELLAEELKSISEIQITTTRIRLNPAKPLDSEIQIETKVSSLQKKIVIIVDDVANTGRTLFYAIEPLLRTMPKKVEMAVLVDRTHKSFPVHPDYVGTSLATTLQENIQVKIRDTKDWAVYLD